jgi:AbrB family looped-hinge helix DNA binding protein
MGHTVGPKGQIVISKHIRDRLGVEPGWHALQVLVDDHVEIYFIPPPHNRSLAGCLAPYIRPIADDQDEAAWDEAVGQAVAQDFRNGLLDEEEAS